MELLLFAGMTTTLQHSTAVNQGTGTLQCWDRDSSFAVDTDAQLSMDIMLAGTRAIILDWLFTGCAKK